MRWLSIPVVNAANKDAVRARGKHFNLTSQVIMYSSLLSFIEAVEKDIVSLPETRKKTLLRISDYLNVQIAAGSRASLIFICTHNSRRSHLTQIWASTAARHYGIDSIQTFSGGTEVTAFNPRAVAAIERAGFKVEKPGGGNPRYRVFYSDDRSPLECYSKLYDDSANPGHDFAAVMTCSEAEKNCPFIPGADLRISLPYEDPKKADGTPDESRIYDKRCRQIAAEMCYLMRQVARNNS
jgi:arsenate reductase